MLNSPSGRHQFSLAVTLFLLSTILVLAILWKVYQPKPESTVPAEYHYRLDDLDSADTVFEHAPLESRIPSR